MTSKGGRYYIRLPPRAKTHANVCRWRFMKHTGDKPFNCTKCCKSFSGLKYLKVPSEDPWRKQPMKSQEFFHITIHEGNYNEEKPFNCTECGKRFSWSRDLKYNQRILEGNNHWSATNVTGAFPHQVKIHERNHTGEKLFIQLHRVWQKLLRIKI